MNAPQPRRRINLTVDPELWARCQEVAQQVPSGINWSRVAEAAFESHLRWIAEVRAKLARLDESQATIANAAMMVFDATIKGDTGRAHQLLDALEDRSPP